MEIPKHICVSCGRGFGKNSDLTRHTQKVHAKQVPTCTVCDRHYSRRDNLQAHMTRTHGTSVTGPTNGKETSETRVGSKPYNDNLCFFRCLAVFRVAPIRNVRTSTTDLFRQWQNVSD
jgi:uncharacterized Zn-finger protein